MDADIRPMWPTPIWIGQVDADVLSQVSGHADPETEIDLGPHTRSIPSVTDVERTMAGAFDLDSDRLRWRHRIEVWPTGFQRGMTYSHAAVRVLVIVNSNRPSEHPDSGVLSLHDPRTGAANVALPGLPWGRAAKIPPMAGGAIAIPGWLGCSIAPLRSSHIMTVWTAEALPVER